MVRRLITGHEQTIKYVASAFEFGHFKISKKKKLSGNAHIVESASRISHNETNTRELFIVRSTPPFTILNKSGIWFFPLIDVAAQCSIFQTLTC